jgi:hypothetical protein
MTKKILFPVLALVLMLIFFSIYNQTQKQSAEPKDPIVSDVEVNNFNDCVKEGNPIMESYPRQCRSLDGRLFVEDIGNINEKNDLIQLNYPLPNQEISSPLEITGTARGLWYFEADFPIVLLNSQGDIISQGIATAQDDWMTEEFVPFTTILSFDIPESERGQEGRLIFQKDNPSGLAENEDSLEFPVIFSF